MKTKIINYYLQRVKQIRRKNNLYSYKQNYFKSFDNLGIPTGSTIFVYCGIGAVRKSLNTSADDAFDRLVAFLHETFKPKRIVCPTYTPSFRITGTFSLNHTRAEYGYFNELARIKANHRIPDPLHSVAIFGAPYKRKFSFDTFGSDSVFRCDDDVYILNIGTQYFTSTHLHFIEEYCGVPYKISSKKYEGIYFDESDTPKLIKTLNHGYREKVLINRGKLSRALCKEGALSLKDEISCIRASDLFDIVKRSIERDPYYLVSL